MSRLMPLPGESWTLETFADSIIFVYISLTPIGIQRAENRSSYGNFNLEGKYASKK